MQLKYRNKSSSQSTISYPETENFLLASTCPTLNLASVHYLYWSTKEYAVTCKSFAWAEIAFQLLNNNKKV